MKNKILMLALLCAALLLCGCDGKTDASNGNAPTESEDGYYLYYTDGLRYNNICDAEGRVTERVCFDKEGGFVSSTQFSYKEDGILIREYDNEYNLVSHTDCKGDSSTSHIYVNNVIKYVYRYKNSVLLEKVDYVDGYPDLTTVFNEKGVMVKSIKHTKNGGVMTETVYEHTEQGYYSSVTTNNAKGETTARTEYIYDDNGKQTAELVYKYENGVAVSYEKWVTDKEGKRVLEGSYDL